MALRHICQSLSQFIREKLITLNIYDSRSSDLTIIHREIIYTRVFILLLIISISILSGYTLVSEQHKSETITSPTQSIYKNLKNKYPDTLQCPCKQISISYKKFLNITPSFHQICLSDFISQRWIDFVFVKNSSLIWPIDVRTSLSSMFRLINTLCQTSINTTINIFDQFINSPLINSIVISQQLLEANIQAALNIILQTASNNLIKPLIGLHRITQANEFSTALSINYIAASEYLMLFDVAYEGDFVISVDTIENRYIFNQSIGSCNCRFNGTCPMSANFYLYDIWETYGIYDFNLIQSNGTLPGIIIDCLPLQTVFTSTLECFYNQSCLNQLFFIYQNSINISILNASKLIHFFPTTKIELLIRELFIETINKEINFEKYYLECKPIYCSYSYSNRFDIIYLITTLLAVFGGLTTALRLITPFLVNSILSIKNYRSTKNEIQQIEKESIQIRIRNLIYKIKKSIVELNLFDKNISNQSFIIYERMKTWLFIILFISSICILIFYTYLSTQKIIKTIQFPIQQQYEDLLKQFPETLQCPCTVLSIPYENFIEIKPIYHQICQSDFVQSWWYENLNSNYLPALTAEFESVISLHFRTLATFCEIVNLTVTEAIRQFSGTLLVNAQVLPFDSFTSQVRASIDTFQNLTQAEFLYTMSMINSLLEANQYVSNKRQSTNLLKKYIPELEQSNLGPVRISSLSLGTYDNDDGNWCFCILDSKCNIDVMLYLEGVPFHYFSDISGLVNGCFTVNSVLKSSLLCWYEIDCIEKLRVDLEFAGVTYIPNVTVLNSQLSSRFALNVSTQTIVDEMMIEKWVSSISYENFYQKCNPSYCTYSYTQKSDIAFIITTIIAFIGGLNIVLRLISILFIGIFSICIKKTGLNDTIQTWADQNRDPQNNSINVISSNILSRFRDKFIQFNLFDTKSNEIHIIQRERFITRFYLLALIICIVIVTIHTSFSKQTTTIVISNPNQTQYEDLFISHSHTIQCPCAQVSILHKDFITINATFHQVCSSEFTQYFWKMYLFGWQNWYDYERADIRGRGAAYFSFLSSLCKLSQTTVSNIVAQFLIETFVSAQIIHESEFRSQMNITTYRFKEITPEQFSHILIFMNRIAQDSNFVSSYFLNWNWWMAYNSSMVTLPTRAVTLNDGCSCGTQNECIQSGGVYGSYSDIQYFSIPGWYIGCSTVDTLLHSTLECFYNQSCIDLLMYYLTTVEIIYPIPWEISPLNPNITSRFKSDTIIQEIVDRLFVEKWQIDVSYSKFYKQCAPTYCSYIIEENNDFAFILTKILGLYGGLTVALRIIIPALIQIAFKIRDRCCKNRINPVA